MGIFRSKIRTLCIWDLDGTLLGLTQAHGSYIYKVVKVSSDSVATVGEDGVLKTWTFGRGTLSLDSFVHLSFHTIWSVLQHDNVFVCAADSGDLFACRLDSGEYSIFDASSMDPSKVIYWTQDILDGLPEHFAQGSQAIARAPNDDDGLGIHMFFNGRWVQVGRCSRRGFDRKISISLPTEEQVELVIPLGVPYDEAIQRFMVSNGISESFREQIVQFVTSNLGSDPTSAKYRLFDRINASGVLSKVRELSTANGKRCQVVSLDFDDLCAKSLLELLSATEQDKKYPCTAQVNLLVLDVLRLWSLDRLQFMTLFAHEAFRTHLFATYSDKNCEKMRLRLWTNLFAHSMGRLLVANCLSELYRVLRNISDVHYFTEELLCLQSNLKQLSGSVPSMEIVSDKIHGLFT